MPKDSAPTRRSILNAGFQLFFKRGYARVSMDDIAAKAGLTKRTLYYHFNSKDALVGAVLRGQNEQTLQQFQSWVDPLAQTPVEFSDSLFGKLLLWSQKPDWRGSGYTRLALELTDLPGHPARLAAKVHKAAIEAWLSRQLELRHAENFEDKARAVAVLLEGAMTLALVHGDPNYIETARTNAQMILQPRDENRHT